MKEDLNSIINFFKNNLKSDLKTSYLIGSYASQDFFIHSDIDLIFCCNGDNKLECEKNFNQCVEIFQNNAVKLDCRFIWLPQCDSIPVELKQGRLLFGEDVLLAIPPESTKSYLTRTAQIVCTCIASLRQFSNNSLVYPLEYPNNDDYYYGYFQENSRSFLNTNLYIARFFLYEKKRIVSNSKKETFLLFRKYFDDEWSYYIEDTYLLCHDLLQYTLPTDLENKNKLKKNCRKTLLLENYFLQTLHKLLNSNSEIISIDEFKVK